MQSVIDGARSWRGVFSALSVMALLLCLPSAWAAERVALVIGNSQYAHAGPLPNTKNDASDVAKALEARGFSVEAPLLDAGKTAMDEALARFARRAVGAQQAVVFFAGHGIEVAGQNYLLPVDAELATSRTVEFEAVKLSSVLNAVGGARQFGMVVLDACRNNPFVPRLAASDPVWASRSVDRGLARIEPEGNVLVAYAAEAGTTAADSAGAGARNSPFTVALLEALRAPPKDVRLMLGGVRDRVMAMTASEQKPFLYGSLGGDEVVLGQASTPRRIEPQPVPPPPPVAVINASTPPKTVFFDRLKSGGEGPAMVVLPSGSFVMGSPESESGRSSSEGPQRRVQIRAFALGQTEVTFAEWDRCVERGGCTHRPSDEGWGRGERPVMNVNWEDAQQYMAWLSRETGHAYRLPSEAEWEYAARAGTTTAYSWGDAIGRNRANCYGCGSVWDNRQTAPVRSSAANPWGLYEMHGNVWEWTQDCWNASYPTGRAFAPMVGSACNRVLRGGSWVSDPARLRSAGRGRSPPADRDTLGGFRLARTL